MKIFVVCGFCMDHDENPAIEINFRDGVLYHVCQKCKKTNKLELKAIESKPYAKSTTMRR